MPDMVSPIEYGIFIIGTIAAVFYGVAKLVIHLFTKR